MGDALGAVWMGKKGKGSEWEEGLELRREMRWAKCLVEDGKLY